MIQHSLGTFGNATGIKLIEQSFGRDGNFYNSATAATIIQFNSSLGDNVHTPSSTGFLGDGKTYLYSVYARALVNGALIYSYTPFVNGVTLPNDGLNYNINISYGSVSGATYKLSRQIDSGGLQYHVQSGTSFVDSTVQYWGETSTLTPNESIGSTGILDWSSALTSQSALLIRNKTNSLMGAMEFQYSTGGGAFAFAAKIGVNTLGNAFIDAYNHGLEIGSEGSPYARISVVQGTVFNFQGSNSSSASFRYRGNTVNYLAYFDPPCTLR